jgi:hypothetical protein
VDEHQEEFVHYHSNIDEDMTEYEDFVAIPRYRYTMDSPLKEINCQKKKFIILYLTWVGSRHCIFF